MEVNESTPQSQAEPERPLVSVITVCFNAAPYIEQCMRSVLSQQFDDFEYVVIDGGSTDGTREIIEQHAGQLAYWHSKPDRGLGHAFNLGVEHSRGRWLLYLNADDYFADDMALGKLAEALRAHPQADVVYGQVMVVSREVAPRRIGGPYGGPFHWRRFLLNDIIPHQAAATNRQLFERAGLFREDIRIAVDYEHFLRVGPKLEARFVPILVACMRDGGMSKESINATLKDWHRARTMAGAMSVPLSGLVYYYHFIRFYIGRCVRRLFGITR